MDTQEKLKTIKRSFRLRMNGVVAQSMRNKGLDYHINWGLSIADIKELASEYGKDYSLAIELWKENIRECKIMATIIMPPEDMLPEIVDLWMEQTHSLELAEQSVFNLYQYLDFAPLLAYQWMAATDDLYQVAGFHLLSRLLSQGKEPDERGISEFIDQAVVALQGGSLPVRHAALSCLRRFADLSDGHQRLAEGALKRAKLDFF
ncbi:MAG: DNA alkylation repair protein [Prevotella sp.]|nr:DNA alkylation repair protein [Prevotella sp.]